MSQNYMQNYTSSPAHHGIGFMAVTDKAGPISRVDGGFTYAYHLQLNGANNLAVGVYAGLSRIALDVNAITLENNLDPALANMSAAQLKPDMGLGIMALVFSLVLQCSKFYHRNYHFPIMRTTTLENLFHTFLLRLDTNSS